MRESEKNKRKQEVGSNLHRMDCDKIGWVESRSNGSGQVYDRGAREPSNFWHVEARV